MKVSWAMSSTQIDITHHAADETLDPSLVFDDQQFESPLITLQGTAHQLGIAVRIRGLGWDGLSHQAWQCS